MKKDTKWEAAVAGLRPIIAELPERTKDDIRAAVSEFAEVIPAIRDEAGMMEKLARYFESIYDVKQSVGKIIRQGYKPWLEKARADQKITPYYWTRYSAYLQEELKLPPEVSVTLNADTDEILDHAGNPHVASNWKKRGMVLGQVQSGKTTNYSALICKAADAGYKVIVLLSGISNILRQQTQRRIDEAFIGRQAIFQPGETTKVGVGHHVPYGDPVRFPFYGTTADFDFNSVVARNYGVSIKGTNEPIVFVIKKNWSILSGLRQWLQAEYPNGNIPFPLLLIDDEADNASINTHKDPGKATRINGEIRQLLDLFNRRSYIGYTATPFANIFIEPDCESDMLQHDLFPADFIKALNPPTNYVGANKVFPEDEEKPTIVRIIDDAGEIPLKHDGTFQIRQLPQSLQRAIRLFVLCRAMFIAKGEADNHSTMMINVSRFIAIQAQISVLTRDYLDKINRAARMHAGEASGEESNSHMADLKRDFESEYGAQGAWGGVRGHLAEASGVSVKTVNSKGDVLDYAQHKEHGLHTIAVGGFSLSRGLTLEGLCISYLIRNAGAYDTLMQMARWFGYRDGYEDICRVFIPEETRDRYGFVREATDELRGEVESMNTLEKTPAEFGLKVRRHRASVFQITARNKMRQAKTMMVANDLSLGHVEARVLFADKAINGKNYELVCDFAKQRGKCMPITDNPAHGDYLFWRGVPMDAIRRFLTSFQLPGKNPWLSGFGASLGDNPVLDYMDDRTRELSDWDVCIPVNKKAESANPPASVNIAGSKVVLRERKKGDDMDGGLYKVMPTRLSARMDAAIGLSKKEVGEIKTDLSDRTLNAKRKNPLLLIHVVNAKYRDDEKKPPFDGAPAVAYSIFFPDTKEEIREREYAVNLVYQRWIEGTMNDMTQIEEEEDDE